MTERGPRTRDGGADGAGPLGADRAARELGLRRGEFELAVDLGHVRAVARGPLGARRVERSEIGRLRAAEGFPGALRERVRTVDTARGAELMGISPGRFLRLARAGALVPVRFCLNRYRAVVWLYLVEELLAFAAAEPLLLRGRLPLPLRLGAESEDRRPPGWRARRTATLLRRSTGVWERAAAAAAVLADGELERLLPDGAERSRLLALRPRMAGGGPQTERAREVQEAVTTARDPEEVLWYGTRAQALVRLARVLEPEAPVSAAVPPATGGGRAPRGGPAVAHATAGRDGGVADVTTGSPSDAGAPPLPGQEPARAGAEGSARPGPAAGTARRRTAVGKGRGESVRGRPGRRPARAGTDHGRPPRGGTHPEGGRSGPRPVAAPVRGA
ncbi:DUF6397 family protein [Streptomyces sp. NPDC047002]|uniref:DUF6397 family protein n=1 Tax=Streptomyces sp. NPDC047002 TaxID=3155475 RepID=UPI0034532938